MRFEFATATRIVFGEGAAATLPELVRSFGARPFVVTGSSRERASWLVSALSAEVLAVPGEPTVDLVRDGARRARKAACDVVVALGGGSAINAGKAIACIATNGGEPLEFLEVVGKGRVLSAAPLPFIAAPTTAGTGSEVTRNAVLASAEHGVKASLRSPMMLPRVALVDPELTYSLPSAATASTGLDALTQLIEPYVSARANPLADALCVEGIGRAAGALGRVYRDGMDRQARRDMALASLFGGLALANAGLGVVHGFAAPLGGQWNVPHGALCAALLPSMSLFDFIANDMRQSFQPSPDSTPYEAVEPQQSIYETTPDLNALDGQNKLDAIASARMDWREPDDVPSEQLNQILWRNAMNTEFPSWKRHSVAFQMPAAR